MGDLKPVFELRNSLMKQISERIDTLPCDCKDICRLAIGNGQNITRLSCCIKLLLELKNQIPDLSLSSKSSINIDKENPAFETNFEPSIQYSSLSITTIYTCCLLSIGKDAIYQYLKSNTASNPFCQCFRILVRYLWFLKCRHTVLSDLKTENRLSIINQTLRLSSFRDLCRGAQRAAIYSAICSPNKVDLKLFASYIPKLFLTGNTRQLYQDFIMSLDENNSSALSDYELESDRIIKDNLALKYFSCKTTIEDTVFSMLQLESIYRTPLEDLMSCFLFELAPDNEYQRFKGSITQIVFQAFRIKVPVSKRLFDLVFFENFSEPPKNQHVEKKVESGPDDESLFSIFLKPNPTKKR